MKFRVNYFQSSKDRVRYELINTLYLLLFILPITISAIFEISESFLLFSFICLVFIWVLVKYNRILPNSILIIENENLYILRNKNKLSIMLSDISSVEVCKTKKTNETYIIFYIKKGNDIVADFSVDKFYLFSAKNRAKKIVFELRNHLKNGIVKSEL